MHKPTNFSTWVCFVRLFRVINCSLYIQFSVPQADSLGAYINFVTFRNPEVEFGTHLQISVDLPQSRDTLVSAVHRLLLLPNVTVSLTPVDSRQDQVHLENIGRVNTIFKKHWPLLNKVACSLHDGVLAT